MISGFWNQDCISSGGVNDEHRMWLSRDTHKPWIGHGPVHDMLIVVMLNPSKARGRGVTGAMIGDPTQRKIGGFAARLNCSRYGILNLFTRSTPYPEELFTFDFEGANHAEADDYLKHTFAEAVLQRWPVVFAWGKPNLPKRELAYVALRAMLVQDLADQIGLSPFCFALTDDQRWPRHPLMLGYEHGLPIRPYTVYRDLV